MRIVSVIPRDLHASLLVADQQQRLATVSYWGGYALLVGIGVRNRAAQTTHQVSKMEPSRDQPCSEAARLRSSEVEEKHVGRRGQMICSGARGVLFLRLCSACLFTEAIYPFSWVYPCSLPSCATMTLSHRTARQRYKEPEILSELLKNEAAVAAAAASVISHSWALGSNRDASGTREGVR